MIIEDMEDEIRQLEQVYRSLDANKNSLMSDLKLLANDILDKLNRHSDFPNDIKPHLKQAKNLAREVNESNTQDEAVRAMLSRNEQAPEQTPEPPVIAETTDIPEVAETLPPPVEEEVLPVLDEQPEAAYESQPEEPAEMPDYPQEEALTPDAPEAPSEDEATVDSDEEKENKGSFFDQFD